MKNLFNFPLLLLALGFTLPAEGRDSRTFRDYAPVLNVEPVVETTYEPATRTICDERRLETERATVLAPTIAEDVRRQIRVSREQKVCRTVTERHQRQQVRGYRVTYRYGGQTTTARYPYDPGERIPVDISLSPLP